MRFRRPRARARALPLESLGAQSNLFARHQTVLEIGGIAMHICYAFQCALDKPLGAKYIVAYGMELVNVSERIP